MHIRIRSKAIGKHVVARVFCGEDEDHLALAGRLCLRVGEWQLFGAALLLGAARTHGHLTVDSPDDTVVAQYDLVMPLTKYQETAIQDLSEGN